MYKSTRDALEIILKEDYNKKNPKQSFPACECEEHILEFQPGETIITQGHPAKYVYFLLSGRTVIMNSISWSTSNILDYVEPPHMLGLQENMSGIENYTAFVVAETNCILFRISAEDFLSLIHSDAELCYYALDIQVKVSEDSMSQTETNRIFPARDMLGLWLYSRAKDSVPYVCPLTRAKLSEELNINLRSLYRYIDSLKEDGCLVLRHGKLVIEDQNLEKLKERYDNIVM